MADIFDEVTEELRQDQLKQFWQKYQKFIFGIIFIILLTVGSYQGYSSNYKYGTQVNSGTGGDTGFFNNIFAAVPLKNALDKELRKGMWINFPNNIKMEILRNVKSGSKILKGFEIRNGYYYTADFTLHYPTDNGGVQKR